MHYVNKRKIALQNKPNLAKCAQNCEKVNNLISILKAKFWLEHFFILFIQKKSSWKSNDYGPLQPLSPFSPLRTVQFSPRIQSKCQTFPLKKDEHLTE